MDVCICDFKTRTKVREPRDGAETLRRALDIVSFVESFAKTLLGAEDSLESVGSLSLERLEQPGEGDALFLQGKVCLQDSLQSRSVESELPQSGLSLGEAMDSVQAIEITRFAGYGMYSISHQNGTIEAVFYDPSLNKHEYKTWSEAS